MAPSTARDETKSGPPAALSSEQHAKIRDTLRVKKSERLTSVPFSHKVGEAIPGTVHLYALPVSIMEYAPQYRGYEYILVGDEILIVDPRTLRISSGDCRLSWDRRHPCQTMRAARAALIAHEP